jgi:hypothetical protein
MTTIGGGGKGRVIACWWELPAMAGVAGCRGVAMAAIGGRRRGRVE